MLRRHPFRAAAATFVLAGSTALSAVAPASSATPPMASPPCFGPSCVGRDPYISNAAGRCVNYSRQIATVDSPQHDTTVALMYSDWCGSNWARYLWSSAPGYQRYYVQSADRVSQPGDFGNYTLMVDGVQLARACTKSVLNSGDERTNCTLWH